MALLNKFQKFGSILTPLKGNRPKSTLIKDVIPVNNTFSKGQYQDYVLNIDRAQDTTGNI
jgi:hypothetical protein